MLGANDGFSTSTPALVMLWLSAIVVLPFVVDLLVNRRVWGPRWPDLFSGSTSGSLHHFYRRDPEVGQVHTPQQPEETGIGGALVACRTL